MSSQHVPVATPAEFEAAGVSPQEAQALATQANLLAGRGSIEDVALARHVLSQDYAPPPKPASAPTATPAATPAVAHAAIEAADTAALHAHFDDIFAPPASAHAYRIPNPVGEPSDEAMAGDRALTQVLHRAGLPTNLGNAILQDLANTRPPTWTHKPDTIAAIKPWFDQLFKQALQDPALRPIAQGLDPDRLLALLSLETAIALVPFVQHRARRR
jgi:hypothetical protein